MYLTYACMNRVFVKYCMIFLSKMGFYLGKDFLEVNECHDECFLSTLGFSNYWAEGPVPPKVKEMPSAPLIFKYLST